MHRLRTRPGLAATRRGAIIVIAMISLLLVSAIAVSLVRLALTQQRQVRREQIRLQAEWLAEAGLERGAAKLRRDSDYQGEQWTIPAEHLDGRRSALVRITAQPAEETGGTTILKVIATYPEETEHRAQVTREVSISQ